MSWFDNIFKPRSRSTDPESPASSEPRAGNRLGAAEALFDSGRAAFQDGDYAVAIKRLNAVLEIAHDHAKAHYYLGLIHFNQNRYEDAVDCFVMATHFMPNFSQAYYHLGLEARRRRNYREAAAHFERAIELKPDFAQAHNNLGYTLLTELEDYERGAHHIETARRLLPEDSDILCNYSAVLLHRGQLEETLALCTRLLAAQPQLHEARLNRALAALKRGEFAHGWQDYEARKFASGNYVPKDFGFPEWNGEPLAGKSILVYAEQGLGDQLMFASCLPELLARSERCILECAPALEKLFRRSFPRAAVHAGNGANPARSLPTQLGMIDFQVAIGSLPGHFRADASRFPVHSGYLYTDPTRIAYWKQRLTALGTGLKIGISWRGGAASTRRELRSTSLGEWLPLLSLQDCRFVSLQYGDVGQELAALERDHAVHIFHSQDAIDDYDETAALICALDLVISVQTAVVHLSGALGRAAWVMVPGVPEWRYLQYGETIPWYPSVKVLRREASGSWRALIEKATCALAQLGAGKRC